jgi:hypothetical protein
MRDAWSVYGINMLRERVESSSRLLFTTPARIAGHLNRRNIRAATRETSLKFCKRNTSSVTAGVSRLCGNGPRPDLVTGQPPSKNGSFAPQAGRSGRLAHRLKADVRNPSVN